MSAAHATARHGAPWQSHWAGALVCLAVAGLTAVGLLALFSASQSISGEGTVILLRQLMWLALALCAGAMACLVPPEGWRKLVWPAAVLSFLLLLAVLVPGIGTKVNGARRWIDLGPMNMQVSDFAKLGFLFLLAHYLAANQRHLGELVRGYLVPLALIAVPSALILLQPDYGTAFLFGLVGFLLLFLAGARLLYLVPTGLLGIAAFSVLVFLDPVRLRRVLSFIDVQAHKSDASYQLWQGILAFGAGGWSGVGLGNGRQQMAYLPEAHTDFIFAILGEEMGFLATGLVVCAFAAIFLAVAFNLRRAPNLFHYLLVAGALSFLVLQALINMGVVTGLLPTKGMSLPFISYGGSNLVVMFFLVGLLLGGLRSWNRIPLKRVREL